jgi:hypothetical protein
MLLGPFLFWQIIGILQELAGKGKCIIMRLKDFGLSLVLLHALEEKRR